MLGATGAQAAQQGQQQQGTGDGPADGLPVAQGFLIQLWRDAGADQGGEQGDFAARCAHRGQQVDHRRQQQDAVDAAKLPQIEAKIIMAPSTSTEIAGDKLKSFLKLVDLLEDNDDVQNVWHNADYEEPEE